MSEGFDFKGWSCLFSFGIAVERSGGIRVLGVVSGNDPMDLFLDSVQVVKDVFFAIRSGIKKAAKDLEYSWLGLKKIGPSNDVDLFGEANCGVGVGNSVKNSKIIA
ncbi:hypothetical protein Ancab_023495 [Ancistrocladus abbreviatus]